MVNRGLKSGTVSVYGSAVRGFMRWFDALMAGKGLGVCDVTEGSAWTTTRDSACGGEGH